MQLLHQNSASSPPFYSPTQLQLTKVVNHELQLIETFAYPDPLPTDNNPRFPRVLALLTCAYPDLLNHKVGIRRTITTITPTLLCFQLFNAFERDLEQRPRGSLVSVPCLTLVRPFWHMQAKEPTPATFAQLHHAHVRLLFLSGRKAHSFCKIRSSQSYRGITATRHQFAIISLGIFSPACMTGIQPRWLWDPSNTVFGRSFRSIELFSPTFFVWMGIRLSYLAYLVPCSTRQHLLHFLTLPRIFFRHYQSHIPNFLLCTFFFVTTRVTTFSRYGYQLPSSLHHTGRLFTFCTIPTRLSLPSLLVHTRYSYFCSRLLGYALFFWYIRGIIVVREWWKRYP
jgi:hypothetical protein